MMVGAQLGHVGLQPAARRQVVAEDLLLAADLQAP